MDSQSRTKQLLTDLIKQLSNKIDINDVALYKYIRMLRPTTNEVNSGKYSSAIKRRLRDIILNHRDHLGDGPHQISCLEKEIDSVRRTNPSLINSFLAFIEPFCFLQSENYYKCIVDTSGSLSDVIKEGDKRLEDMKVPPEVKISLPVPDSLPAGNLEADEKQKVFAPNLWISNETETKVLRDLLFIFQV